MSELFLFGDRVWFYAWGGGDGGPEPEHLREGLVVGTFVKQEVSLGGFVTPVPRVHVAYAEEPDANSSGGHMRANVTNVPVEWVFRCREDAAFWAQDRINARVAALRELQARWAALPAGDEHHGG